MKTIYDALQWGVSKLEQREIPNPILEARVLLATLLEVDSLHILVNKDQILTPEVIEDFSNGIKARTQGVPMQYITGKQEFMGLDFTVNESVLIPRPDTEILVEKAITLLQESQGEKVLDVCTGSGCIAISIAHFVPDASVTALDLSKDALKVAQHNATTLQVNDRVEFIHSDLFEAINNDTVYDMIVSNPPYIPREDVEQLMIEVKDHEPRMALDGGMDGLDFYVKISEEAQHYLTDEGWLLFEIGYDQGEAVQQILLNNSYKNIFLLKDLAGLDRVVGAQK